MTEAVPGHIAEERPKPLNLHVRNQMRKMPRAGSSIEKAVRSELHGRGLRFRVNYRGLPGTPDIAFTRAKLAVFIDGCFWHACPVHGTVPKNNREWWEAKLALRVSECVADRRAWFGVAQHVGVLAGTR